MTHLQPALQGPRPCGPHLPETRVRRWKGDFPLPGRWRGTGLACQKVTVVFPAGGAGEQDDGVREGARVHRGGGQGGQGRPDTGQGGPPSPA